MEEAEEVVVETRTPFASALPLLFLEMFPQPAALPAFDDFLELTTRAAAERVAEARVEAARAAAAKAEAVVMRARAAEPVVRPLSQMAAAVRARAAVAVVAAVKVVVAAAVKVARAPA